MGNVQNGADLTGQDACDEKMHDDNVSGGHGKGQVAKDFAIDKCLARSLKPLQPHQKQFIKAFMRSTRRGTIAIHSPGSGKTLMAMGAAKCYLNEYPDSRVIIVAPASLIGAHEKQLADFEKKLPGGRVPGASKFSFYTYSGFSRAIHAGEIRMCEGALVICDEAQALKGAETQIFEDIRACAGLSTKVILLSATPITNVDDDLMNLMTVASGGPVLDTYTMNEILGNDQLMRAFFGCQLSWYTSDPKKMAPYFPRKETRIVPIVMDSATLRTYETLENDKTSRAIEGIFSLSGESADTDLQSFFNGLRRISSSSAQKIEFIIDYIQHVKARKTSAHLGITKQSLEKHTDKFIIFTHFKDHGSAKIIVALKKAEIGYGVIDGSVPKSQRARIEADYVAGKISVILISAAGSTGLNLFETGYIFLMEPSWNNSEVQQVEARGVRYLGHAKLPKSKQNVLVIKLLLIKPAESRDFAKIIADTRVHYNTALDKPSIDIKMFVDSNRKQAAIDARLAMIKGKVPSIERCAQAKVDIKSFEEMRVFHRTSAHIASVPTGIKTHGSYYAAGRRVERSEDARVSFNDDMLKEIVSGSGVLRLKDDTAILLAGSTEIVRDVLMDANSHVFPHEFDPKVTLNKRYRIGIINFGINFATGGHVPCVPRIRKNVLKQMNEHCDLLLIVIRDADWDRTEIEDELVGRTFSEARYRSDFDKIVAGRHNGITVIAC
jgi:superfamily II DNA or RNA helicase